MTNDYYDGPVVFVDGVHYATDPEGHADKSRPLRWVEGATYRLAEDNEPLHNERFIGHDVVFTPGTE